jgi:hypothetical protein
MRVIAIISSSAMFVSVHSVGTVATYIGILVPFPYGIFLSEDAVFWVRYSCSASGVSLSSGSSFRSGTDVLRNEKKKFSKTCHFHVTDLFTLLSVHGVW